MDFLHRNANNQPQRDGVAGFNSVTTDKIKKAVRHEPRWMRGIFVILLFSLTILGVAITLLLYFGKPNETNFVNKDKVQAVFLTNGQVYFGKVTDVTSQYLNIQDIYYLNSQQGTDENKTTNFSLIKLGCELHGPADQMIINRDQVTFWENLKSDGKVTKAIEQWRSQNPNGLQCKETTDSTQQSTTNSSTQNTNTNNNSNSNNSQNNN